MQNVRKKSSNSDDVRSRTAWHPAFVEAIKEDLKEYQDVLEFIDEYQLTSEPLRIDCVIIKKAKGTIIRKNIATIFRGVNLLEYKSPSESLSIDGFYKVHSYATLYASLKSIPITDITVSFVGSRYPRTVVEHLRNVCGYTVEKTHAGIYTVTGAIFPVQFIDSRKLSAKDGELLRSLRTLGFEEGVNTFERIALQNEDKKRRLMAYLAVMLQNNAPAAQEVMMRGKITFEQMVENTGLAAKWEARGRSQAEAEAEAKAEAKTEAIKLEFAKFLIEQGLPFETVVLGSKLPPEQVRELASGKHR